MRCSWRRFEGLGCITTRGLATIAAGLQLDLMLSHSHLLFIPHAGAASGVSAAPPSPPSTTWQSALRRYRPWLMGCVWSVCLALSAFSFWKAAAPTSPLGADGGEAVAAASPGLEVSSRKLVTRPIQEIRPGMRVIADNPELDEMDELLGGAEEDTEIVPAEWRQVSLFREEEHGRFVCERLIPLSEIEAKGIKPGSTLEMDLFEIDLHGAVEVKSISPCPEIEPDDGTGRRIVTAVFRHVADNVIDLSIAGESKPIGCTDNHPFWRVDRQEFVEAGKLRIGELVLADNGTPKQVTRITPHRQGHESWSMAVPTLPKTRGSESRHASWIPNSENRHS